MEPSTWLLGALVALIIGVFVVCTAAAMRQNGREAANRDSLNSGALEGSKPEERVSK